MHQEQSELLQRIKSITKESTELQIEYWKMYSDYETWQFWVIILLVIIPLIVLFFVIDRRNILLLGFFGLNYHVWFHYINSVGIKLGLWEYPYQILPFLPSFALDAALVPILFILVYQWTLKYQKNVYIYGIILSGILAFIMKPIMVSVDYFKMYEGVNYIHLFLFYVGLFLLSKLAASLFLHLQQKDK
ncbi:hypothetical protein ACFSTA_04550 [Ornithinibacillus salinisoli]|uniref:Permease n=1 Tax=Ornithinibacillus salinisoli TaxID=1848459 RepID=A0ABW4VWR1_9BACI